MRSTDLTREQLERIEQVVQRHRRYYELLWKRAQANDMPLANRSDAGAHTQAVMSVYRTLRLRGHDPTKTIADGLRTLLQTGTLPLKVLKGFLVAMPRVAPLSTKFKQTQFRIRRFSG